MITIVDYGVGNLESILNMFKRIGVKAQISGDVSEIEKAEKILLPGVGSFDAAMKKMKEKNLIEVLNIKALEEKIPVMGICLGMQLMLEESEEGQEKGLGWFPGKVIKFKFDNNDLKVPHMGWNHTVILNNSCTMVEGIQGFKYYFIHSYYAQVHDEKHKLLSTNYGFDFDSAIVSDNIFGFQFHPEKSHKYGMKLFENFAKI